MQSRFLRFLFRFSLVVIFLMIVIGLLFLKPLDNSPYYQSDYFVRTINAIEKNKQFENCESSDTVKAGWSKSSLIPPFGTPIAIDANRNGRFFDGVHDSIYVRSFVFSQANKKIAYVSVDLLIAPPTVTSILDTILRLEGYDLKNIYLSATHTHCGIGAWHNSFIGEIFAGAYDKRVPIFIAKKNCRKHS